jgi:hypothetical protein
MTFSSLYAGMRMLIGGVCEEYRKSLIGEYLMRLMCLRITKIDIVSRIE